MSDEARKTGLSKDTVKAALETLDRMYVVRFSPPLSMGEMESVNRLPPWAVPVVTRTTTRAAYDAQTLTGKEPF